MPCAAGALEAPLLSTLSFTQGSPGPDFILKRIHTENPKPS